MYSHNNSLIDFMIKIIMLSSILYFEPENVFFFAWYVCLTLLLYFNGMIINLTQVSYYQKTHLLKCSSTCICLYLLIPNNRTIIEFNILKNFFVSFVSYQS